MGQTEKKPRVGLIDELRGLAIVLMVVYHTCYDLVMVFGVNIKLFFAPFVQDLVYVFAGLLIFISGCACRFSSNNLKRGAWCFLLGYLLTVVTSLAIPGEEIRFGILHMLGISMILYELGKKLWDTMPVAVGVVVFCALFAFTFSIQWGELGLWPVSVTLPASWYRTDVLYPLGLPSSHFYSSDYFPLVPWTFLFLAGSYVGKLFRYHKMPKGCYRTHFPALAFVGRHTLVIYLLHQPIIYGILSGVFAVIEWFG